MKELLTTTSTILRPYTVLSYQSYERATTLKAFMIAGVR